MDATINHVRAHVDAGHTVPAEVIPELEAERGSNQ